MDLPPALKDALEVMGFSSPTPVQEQAIPLVLSGRDLLACAQTGTGKTGAFGIPIVARLLKRPGEAALVLAPTRELAVQIHEVLLQLAPRPVKSALLIGGAAMSPQIRALAQGARIIVATPGRLVDHLRRGSAKLRHSGILVLDEADRMLDMGFLPQLREILRELPEQRQTLLFTATLPPEIDKLAQKYLTNPERVMVGPVSKPVTRIRQSVIETTGAGKNDVLLDELIARQGSVLIFTRTKHRTDRLARRLAEYGHSVARIHGDRSQGQRDRAIQGFRSGEYRILVATDIAARGLDIPHIAHVINYDLPQSPEDYVHRIGRTARAGADGEAVCLLVPEDQAQWRRISRLCTQGGTHEQVSRNDLRKAQPGKSQTRKEAGQNGKTRAAQVREGQPPAERRRRRSRSGGNRAGAAASR